MIENWMNFVVFLSEALEREDFDFWIGRKELQINLTPAHTFGGWIFIQWPHDEVTWISTSLFFSLLQTNSNSELLNMAEAFFVLFFSLSLFYKD